MEETLQRLDENEPIFFDSLTQLRMPTWSHGRVALVGDACGCVTLMTGQGASPAVAGAYILATELQKNPKNPTMAYQAYEKTLHPYIRSQQLKIERFAEDLAPNLAFNPYKTNGIL